MIIKQLSVFLENKTGRINDVVHTLGANGINMHAFSMAETADFGILRLIVSDVDKAVEVLREKNFAVMSSCVPYAMSPLLNDSLASGVGTMSSLTPSLRLPSLSLYSYTSAVVM
jgi:hypothetical protein